MNRVILSLSVFISLVMLGACASSPSPEKHQQVEELRAAQRMTMVSSGKPADVLPAFTSFTWSEQYNRVLSAVNSNNQQAVKSYIRNELITYLQSKGYQYQADPMQADVVIGFLFALEDDIADKALQEKFGLVPGLKSHSQETPRYKKGTLLLAVLDADLKKIYWRSALQGFVDLEKDKNDPGTHKMQKILQLMMGDFPKAGR